MGIRCSRREEMEGLMVNWPIIGIMIMTGVIWYNIFVYGFFTTLMWVLIGACIGGIIIKLKEETRV